MRIALFGGSFNPPGLHHIRIVEALSERFDEVVLVPCGPRPDKHSTNEVEPVHRAAMVDLAFRRRPRVRIELFDLEQAVFTPTWMMQERMGSAGEIWHAVGSDLIAGGARGESAIQRTWYRGEDVWRELSFVVLRREGIEIDPADLPPHAEVLEGSFSGASSDVRERAFKNLPIDHLVLPRIAQRIDRYALYKGRLPQRAARYRLDEVRPLVIADEDNPQAIEIARQFDAVGSEDDANLVIAIGGDGTMMHVIRKHWRLRVPMLGINAGHRGFLLNDPDELTASGLAGRELILHHLPLLYVETRVPDGSHGVREVRALAFNDAWVERATSQTAWMEVYVDGELRLEKLVCDGALVATAAGSTAYARAMGATPLRADTPELLLVGSNVVEPFRWRSVHLSLDSMVEFRALDPLKRRLHGYADGILQGDALSMLVRRSHIASVELAYAPRHDLSAKLTELQFPR